MRKQLKEKKRVVSHIIYPVRLEDFRHGESTTCDYLDDVDEHLWEQGIISTTDLRLYCDTGPIQPIPQSTQLEEWSYLKDLKV